VDYLCLLAILIIVLEVTTIKSILLEIVGASIALTKVVVRDPALRSGPILMSL
jgi:hypothetical protein